MNFHEYWIYPRSYEKEPQQMLSFMVKDWFEAMRPYYKCWPSIVSSLGRVNIDISLQELSLSERVLLLRFAVGHEPTIGAAQLCSILSMTSTFSDGFAFVVEALISENGGRRCGLWWYCAADNCTIKEKDRDLRDLGDKYDQKTYGKIITYRAEMATLATKLALSCHLLADDPSIIQPDVLSKDELNYERTKDEKYIEKAHRRGKVGWHIGKTFETIPHFRRPHPALFHTGRGRTIPRIVFRSGSIVHRQKLTKVPTGYITPEGVEVEPD